MGRSHEATVVDTKPLQSGSFAEVWPAATVRRSALDGWVSGVVGMMKKKRTSNTR